MILTKPQRQRVERTHERVHFRLNPWDNGVFGRVYRGYTVFEVTDRELLTIECLWGTLWENNAD